MMSETAIENMTSSYPLFYNGNVSILINPDVYTLHSSVLKKNSEALRRLCGYGDGLDNQMRLILVPADGDYRGILEAQTFESYNNQIENALAGTGSVWSESIRKSWSNLFRIFYNMNLNFESGNPQSLTKEVRETIQVAEELQVSVEGVMKGIEDVLLNLDQKLFFTIMMYPASWANLGKRLNSSAIYQEAIIHIVGRWNSLSPVAMGTLEPCTRELCKRKHLELLLKKRTIEFRMLSYYPPKLQHSTDGDQSCASYANDIHMWMALAFFRQWLCYWTIDRRNHVAHDGGAYFYRTLGSIDPYLSSRDQAYFNLVFPMSAREYDKFDMGVRELKSDLRTFVLPLLVNHSRYISTQLPYLTCCQVEKAELPWNNQAEVDYESLDPTLLKIEDADLRIPAMQDTVRQSSGDTIKTPSIETPDNPSMNISAFNPDLLHTQTPFNCSANASSNFDNLQQQQPGDLLRSSGTAIDGINPYYLDTGSGCLVNPDSPVIRTGPSGGS